VLSTSLAYLLYFELLERIGPTNTSTVTCLLPVVGLLCGVIFLGERWSAGMLVGLLLVLASVLLVNEVRVGSRLMLLPRRRAV